MFQTVLSIVHFIIFLYPIVCIYNYFYYSCYCAIIISQANTLLIMPFMNQKEYHTKIFVIVRFQYRHFLLAYFFSIFELLIR